MRFLRPFLWSLSRFESAEAFQTNGARLLATQVSPARASGSDNSKKTGIGGYLLLIPSIIAGGLGYWQIQRRQWKVELLEDRAARLKADPVNVFGLTDQPEIHQHVHAQGKYATNRSVFIGPRVRNIRGTNEKGYIMVTPLHSKKWNRVVLVNRGWVPENWKNTIRSGEDIPELNAKCMVEINGIIMGSETPSSFVPENKPEIGDWYWIDVPAIARVCGVSENTPLVQVVSTEGEKFKSPTPMDIVRGKKFNPVGNEIYPLEKDVEDLMHFSVMPHDHVTYALTWFTLSGATALMAMSAIRKGRKKLPRK